jgi:hypothetical protein
MSSLSLVSPAFTPASTGFHTSQSQILVQGDPGCVAVTPTGELVVGDVYGGAVVRVTGDYQRRLATIDSGGVAAADRLGGLTVAPDGMMYASRIGHGQAGAIYRITGDGRSEALENVPAKVWRGALAHDGHHLYATQYMRSRSGAFDGTIVEVDDRGNCSQVIDGFLHPTGLAALGSQLIVADARQRAVFRVELSGGRGVFRLQLSADVDRPDSLCACGDDSVLLTSFDDQDGIGVVRRIWLDGTVHVIAQGPWEPRGIAFDGDNVYIATRRTGGLMVFEL